MEFRCLYNIWVEPQYDTDHVAPEPQKVQVLVPGPPDAPQIWTRSVDRDEFIIEWGEPRLWGTKLDGYQASGALVSFVRVTENSFAHDVRSTNLLNHRCTSTGRRQGVRSACRTVKP